MTQYYNDNRMCVAAALRGANCVARETLIRPAVSAARRSSVAGASNCLESMRWRSSRNWLPVRA